MKIFTLLLIFIWIGLGRVRAQEYLLPATGTATYTTCGGTLYDDGGANYDYDRNASGSITLRPATAGAKLKLAFSYCDIDSVNTGLYIYDGPDTKAPLIGRFYAGKLTVYATGSTGALTLALTSYGLPHRGFAATISCETTAPPPPDLAVLSLRLSQQLVPAGETVQARTRIANLAGGLTQFRLRYLLSTDATPDTRDVELSRTDSDMPAGQAGSFGMGLTIPAGTVPGRYYVLAVVQLLGAGAEVSTANNVAATPITIPALATTPDLAVTSLAYGNSSGYGTTLPLAAGSYFTTYALYQNLGRPLASHSELGIFLSADATLSADDRLLGKTPVESSAPDRSTSASLTVRLPPNTALGTYYLLGVADVLDQVIEADEQNNVYAIPLAVGLPTADLLLARLSTLLPAQAGAGGNLTVQATVQNTGSMPLDSAALGYYLSADRLLSADDVLLGHDANTFRSFTRTLTLPPTLPLGIYYLLLVADYRQEVPETDETNNVAALPFTVVTPNVDLKVTTPATSNSSYEMVPGNKVYVRCSLANVGSTAAYPATLGYYLSADQTLSPDDALLTQKQLLPLAGGASQSLDDDLVLPVSVAPGSYYLLLVADYRQEVAETDETNNVVVLPLNVLMPNSDLAIERTFTVLPTRAPAGTAVSAKFYFYNEGTTAAYAPSVGFYLSADNTWSPDDTYVGGYQYSRYYLNFRSGITVTSPVSIPRTTVPSRYYLLGVTDPLGQYTDPNPANNVGYAVLDVTAPQPDLQPLPDPYISAKQVVAGSTLDTECYLNNLGAADAAASRLGYYLSTDPTLSTDDVLIGSTAVGTVLFGNSRIVPGSFTVPPTTAGRRYYVLFVADYLNQLPDLVRANNVSYTILAVTAAPLAAREQLAGAELVVAPVPVASGAPLHVQLTNPARAAEVTLGLYNSLGQLVATRSLTLLPGRRNRAELPTAGLAAGVYVVRLTGADLSATRRVIIE